MFRRRTTIDRWLGSPTAFVGLMAIALTAIVPDYVAAQAAGARRARVTGRVTDAGRYDHGGDHR